MVKGRNVRNPCQTPGLGHDPGNQRLFPKHGEPMSGNNRLFHQWIFHKKRIDSFINHKEGDWAMHTTWEYHLNPMRGSTQQGVRPVMMVANDIVKHLLLVLTGLPFSRI